MHGWIKYFSDGSKERGSDLDIRLKRASWSKGRLDNMVGASVHHGDILLICRCASNYWQSDNYEVSLYERWPSMVTRRLSILMPANMPLGILEKDKRINIAPLADFIQVNNRPTHILDISRPNKQPWLILEADLQTKKVSWRVGANRI